MKRLLAPVAACLLAAACGGPPEPTSGVLITIDTTNPATLGCYGRRTDLTPHLDRLAAESLVYEAAYSVAPLTLPAHASMMTGLYPPRHGVRDNGLAPLTSHAETLAERARERGFQTAAFVAAIVLAAPYGLAQGFDVYDEPGTASASGVHMPERPGTEVTARATAWLRERDPERPFFLWVHYFDPHAPYQPEERYLERLGPKARFPAYLGEVAQADAAIGTLLEVLDAEHGLDRTLVAVVADHGESLYRHGEPTHSVFVYRATMHVPFLLHYPDGYRAGERSADVVSVTDVFPTFLEALGLGAPGDVDGESLFRRTVAPDRGVYFESYSPFLSYGWSPLAGWANRDGHSVHGAEAELFLAADTQQSTNVAANHPDLVRTHRDAIARVHDRSSLPAGDEGLDDEFRSRVKDLGYTGGGDPEAPLPHPLRTNGLPDPKAHLDEMAAFLDAALLAGVGKRREAIERLRDIAARHPDNALALEMLGGHLLEENRIDEAIEALRGMTALGRERKTGLGFLARALERAQRYEEALEVQLRIDELWPGQDDVRAACSRLLRRLGHPQEPESPR